MNVATLPIGSSSSTSYQRQIDSYFARSLPERFPKNIKSALAKSIGKLPLPLSETLLAGSLINGLIFSMQEIMMQLIPKAGSGIVMRGTWLIAIDEAIQEILQYAIYSFLPPLVGALAAKRITKSFELPHFELLGVRLNELKSNIGKKFQVGTIRPQEVHLDARQYAKLPLAKFLCFLAAASSLMGAEIIIPAFKNLVMKRFFKTSDFYTVSGLQERDEEEEVGQVGLKAIENSKRNIKYAILWLLSSIPLFYGLTGLLGRQRNFTESKILERSAHLFQLSSRFDLSKTLLAFGVLTAGLFGYPSVARNKAEEYEVRNRILFFTVPTVLFFKQMVGNLLTWLAGLSLGLKGVIAPACTYFNEVKTGSRDIFDLDLVGIGHDQNRQFTGSLIERLSYLKKENPVKFERTVKLLHFTNHLAPFGIALITGVSVNFWNYLNTIKLHQKEHPVAADSQNSKGKIALAAA